MNHPPHLPPRSCSIPAYYVRQSLPWVTLMLFLSVLAGVASALAAAVWVLPDIGAAGLSDRILLRRDTTPDTLEPYVLNQTRARTVTLYDKTKTVSEGAFPLTARVGEAMLLSSDGWAVLVQDTLKTRSEMLLAVDSQSVSTTIDTIVEDPYTDLVYVHLVGQGFRVAAFGSEEAEGGTVWAIAPGNKIENATIIPAREFIVPEKTYTFDRPELLPQVLPGVPFGSFVVDRRGDVLGLVAKNNVLYPSWLVESHMRQVLQSGKITYPDFGFKGVFVSAIPEAETIISRQGFLVTEVTPKARALGIMPNDIIMTLGNVPFSFETFEKVSLLSTELFITVQRKGERITIRLK